VLFFVLFFVFRVFVVAFRPWAALSDEEFRKISGARVTRLG